MPYTKEEFEREGKEKLAKDPAFIEIMAKNPDIIDRILKDLSIEQRLEGLSIEQRLEGLSGDELFDALSPESRVELQRLVETGEYLEIRRRSENSRRNSSPMDISTLPLV